MTIVITEERAGDVAVQVALMELLQRVVAELCFVDNKDQYHARLQAIEEAVVESISSRRRFPELEQAAEDHIHESASALVTAMITGIRHPG